MAGLPPITPSEAYLSFPLFYSSSSSSSSSTSSCFSSPTSYSLNSVSTLKKTVEIDPFESQDIMRKKAHAQAVNILRLNTFSSIPPGLKPIVDSLAKKIERAYASSFSMPYKKSEIFKGNDEIQRLIGEKRMLENTTAITKPFLSAGICAYKSIYQTLPPHVKKKKTEKPKEFEDISNQKSNELFLLIIQTLPKDFLERPNWEELVEDSAERVSISYTSRLKNRTLKFKVISKLDSELES